MKIINGFLFANQIYNDTPETSPCIINMDLVCSITVKHHPQKNIDYLHVDFGDIDMMIDSDGDINDAFITIANYYEKVDNSWQE